MIRYNQRQNYNQLNRVKYNNSNEEKQTVVPMNLAEADLIVFDQTGKRLGVLESADEPILGQEIGSEDTLTFFLPFKDHKRHLLENENIIEVAKRRYIIRSIMRSRTSSDLEVEVFCEATWYDLQSAEPMGVWEWENATPNEMLYDMLDGTDHTVGRVEIKTKRNLQLDEGLINRLKAMRELPKIFQGELHFNTQNNTVDFLEPVGKSSGSSIVYGKNMDEIEVEYSTSELVTKLYLYGKDNMTIEDAHPEEKEYIENYQFTDNVFVRIMKDERFTNPYHLYDSGVKALDILSKPTGSYFLKLSDLSRLTGLSHEEFHLGYSVWVFDEELEIDEKKRIMKWDYNVKEPWNTEVELENPQPNLSDLLTGIQAGDGHLHSEDSVQRDEMMNLSVFNYLLNSRADDGFSYWQNTGWEISAVDGYSGNSSFKATGESGKTKELSQTIYPSHREQYSISFMSKTDNIQLGPDGEVGIYVTINYEDGTSDEPVFIPLVDGDKN